MRILHWVGLAGCFSILGGCGSSSGGSGGGGGSTSDGGGTSDGGSASDGGGGAGGAVGTGGTGGAGGASAGEIGDACTKDKDCGGDGKFCSLDDPGGQCLKICAKASDCPDDSTCTDEMKCYKTCTKAGDCPRTGYACVDSMTFDHKASKTCDVPD